MPSTDAPRAHPELPAVDDRLAAPETRYEIWDGEVVYVPPADPPHGTRHVQIAALVEAHAGPDFEVAADMLTRTSRVDDVAPDVSVFPAAPNPETGGRQLEQLAFEIVSTQLLGRAGGKAAKLAARGVRRVFAIDVEHSRALEWSAALGSWSVLESGEYLEDPALEVPLPIEAMVHAARSDDAVARALLAKRNAVLEARLARDRAEGVQEGLAEGVARGRAEGVQEGIARGRAESLIAVLEARGIALSDGDRARILDQRDPATLARWTARAATCTRIAEMFEDPEPRSGT